MWHAIVQGVSIGLLICVLVGPVFFAMLGIALHYSKRAAIWFAAGMLLSDIVYGVLAYAGVSAFIVEGPRKTWMYILGGIIFMIMGGHMLHTTLRRRHDDPAEVQLKSHPHRSNFLGQGFITNTLNPGVIFLWIGIVGTSVPHFRHFSTTIVFFLAIFITTFGTDLLKIILAGSIKHLLNKKNLFILHLITGGVLIMLGLFTIVKTLIHV